jgi:putative peptidoglycan lipid II flippase
MEQSEAQDGAARGGREHTGALASAVRVVSGLTLLSRFAGLARDVVTARVFGDGVLASAFRSAYALPNLFRRLFGEGALSAAFLPEYSLLSRDDPRRAASLARIVVRLLALGTGSIAAGLMIVLLVLLAVLPADAERNLSLRLMLLMVPMMPAVCLTAILGGMLQAHGRFGPPAAAPILLNLLQIGAGALFFLGAVSDRTAMAYWVGGAALVASAAQVVWSIRALRGHVDWCAPVAAARAHARTVLGRFLPATIGLGALQLSASIDMFIAMWPVWVGPTALGLVVPLDEKSNAIVSYTAALYQFPLGVFGIAVATAVFPLLSRSANRSEEFAGHLRRGLRLSFFIGLPAAVGLALVREEVVMVIYGGREGYGFSEDGVARAGRVLLGFAPGIWAYSLNHVLTRAFYARGDTKTPMRLSLASVGLNLVLNVSLIWVLREAGLAWATSVSATVQCLMLAFLCGKRVGIRPMDGITWRAFGRVSLLTAVMGACVVGVRRLLPDVATWTGAAVVLGACVGVGGVVYVGLARALRVAELDWLLHPAPQEKRGSGSMFDVG